MLKEGTEPGAIFLAGFTLPGEIATQFDKIEKKAKTAQVCHRYNCCYWHWRIIPGCKSSDRSSLPFLHSAFQRKNIMNNLCRAEYFVRIILSDCSTYSMTENYSIIVTQKAALATEPAIAFRMLKDNLEKKIGKLKAAEKDSGNY